MNLREWFDSTLVAAILILVLSQPSLAAFEERKSGARPWGMGGAFTAIAGDINAIYWNPAGLGQLETTELAATYTEESGLEELEYGLISLASHLGVLGTVALSANRFGSGIYKEYTYIVSGARKFSENIYLGVNLKYLRMDIERNRAGSDVGLDFGFLCNFRDGQLAFGLAGFNLNQPHVGEDLPRRFTVGLAYKPIPRLILALDYGWMRDGRANDDQFRVGFEYRWFRHLALRYGVASDPDRWTAGLGFRMKSLQLDYAYLSHPDFDPTHMVGLTLRFGPRESGDCQRE